MIQIVIVVDEASGSMQVNMPMDTTEHRELCIRALARALEGDDPAALRRGSGGPGCRPYRGRTGGHAGVTAAGDLMGRIRARAVGNAAFLEHEGMCGDVASWGEPDHECAVWIADQLVLIVESDSLKDLLPGCTLPCLNGPSFAAHEPPAAWNGP